MLESYPIVEVREAWALEKVPENLGSKLKFWYHPEETGIDWLFKYSRENTGEHWSEKIAAEVAGLLGVKHAKVELAIFSESLGSVTESFARRGRELIHGNEILARVMPDYDKTAGRGQSHHTLDNILMALERTFVSVAASEVAKRIFASYILLDALIGNTDRHHENWGLLRRRTGSGWADFIAPSFDHASSLGRELQDERRNRLLSENRVGAYAERGHGGIYRLEGERRAPSPLELVRRAIDEYPALFQTAMRRLERVNEDSLREIVARVPEDWMTQAAREFAIALMRYNLSELRKVFR